MRNYYNSRGVANARTRSQADILRVYNAITGGTLDIFKDRLNTLIIKNNEARGTYDSAVMVKGISYYTSELSTANGVSYPVEPLEKAFDSAVTQYGDMKRLSESILAYITRLYTQFNNSADIQAAAFENMQQYLEPVNEYAKEHNPDGSVISFKAIPINIQAEHDYAKLCMLKGLLV